LQKRVGKLEVLTYVLYRGHFFDQIEGHWYVQTTNNWFMHSYANFEVNVTKSQRGAMFQWKWFNAMVLTPSQVTDEIQQDPSGVTFLLNVIAPELVKGFCPVDRPIVILDHRKYNYIIQLQL
jgi:hypothetical protein